MKDDANGSASTCGVALKEWAATCAALQGGRQILLLRKGGIADAGGVFELEHCQFWLWPTGFHQSATLVKTEDRHFIQSEPIRKNEIEFGLWAQVAQVWSLAPEHLQVLGDVSHIWSQSYLDLRASYRPEHPLLCVALRVFEVSNPHLVEMRAEYGGCKSWIELNQSLSTEHSRAVLDEETFEKHLRELNGVLGNGTD